MNAKQLAFDLEHRPALGEDDFLVAPCNADAVAWIDRFPDWPAPVLAVCGAAGCGKTHLARVFMAKIGAVEIDVTKLGDEGTAVFPDVSAVVIEDAAHIAGRPAAEEAMFHLFNQARELQRGILLTASEPPARWPLSLPDLASRLRTAPAPVIGAPDDALLTALLVKMFADRQLEIGTDVLDYVIPRIERSFAAARDFVIDADRLALENKRRISVPLARSVLTT